VDTTPVPVDSSLPASETSSPRKAASHSLSSEVSPRFSRQQELDAEWAEFTQRILAGSRTERPEAAERVNELEGAERKGELERKKGAEPGAKGPGEGSEWAVESEGEATDETPAMGRLPAANFAAKMASLFRKDPPDRDTSKWAVEDVFDDPVEKTAKMGPLGEVEDSNGTAERDRTEAAQRGSDTPEAAAEEGRENRTEADSGSGRDSQVCKVSWADENGSSLEERLGEAMHFRRSKFNAMVAGAELEKRWDGRPLSPPLGYVSRPDLAAKKGAVKAEQQFRELLRSESVSSATPTKREASPNRGASLKPAWVPPSGSPRSADVGDSKHANVQYAVAQRPLSDSGRSGSPLRRTASGDSTGSPLPMRTKNGTPRFSSPPSRRTPRVSSPTASSKPVPYSRMYTQIEPVKLFRIGSKVERSRSVSPESVQKGEWSEIEVGSPNDSGSAMGERSSSADGPTESRRSLNPEKSSTEGRPAEETSRPGVVGREKRVTFANAADIEAGSRDTDAGAERNGGREASSDQRLDFEDVALREGPTKPPEVKQGTGALSGLARKFRDVMGVAKSGNGTEKSSKVDQKLHGSGGNLEEKRTNPTREKWALIAEKEEEEMDEGASLLAEPSGASARDVKAAVARESAGLEAKKAELALRKKRSIIEHRRERARATKELEEVSSILMEPGCLKLRTFVSSRSGDVFLLSFRGRVRP
jgi:hypothetical protein